MRFNSALTTLISFAVIFFINPDSSYSQEFTEEDELISMTVNKVERTDSFPERLRQPNATYKSPRQGNDFVFIHIHVDEKKDLKVDVMDLSSRQPNSPHLIDDQGKIHWPVLYEYHIPPGTMALYGNDGFWLFEMPKEATPVQLKFVYPYRGESPKPKELKYGKIDIDLSHIQ